MPVLDGFIQVAPDSSGKRVRNLQVTVQQPDGTSVTAYMQVIAIADESGNLLALTDYHDHHRQIIDELRAIRLGIELLADVDMSLIERAQELRDEEGGA